MFLVSSCSCLREIHWSQMLSWEWRCSWSSAVRRCSNYIWVINNFIAYEGATYIRGLTVVCSGFCGFLSFVYIMRKARIFCFVKLTCGGRINSVQNCQYYGCWYTGSLRHRAISTRDINYVESINSWFTWGRISTNCLIPIRTEDMKYENMIRSLWKS